MGRQGIYCVLFVVAAICMTTFALSSPGAAEPPKNLNEVAAAVQELSDKAEAAPEPVGVDPPVKLTALARVKLILGLIKAGEAKDIDDKTLAGVLDDFAILGQLRPDDSQELKARFYLAALRKWNYDNRLEVEKARAKAKLDATFDLGQDEPE